MLYLIIAALLVFLNGFFVAAEFAIVRLRSSRLEELVAEGRPGAKLVRNVVQRMDAYLSASQVGITLASLGLGWVGEPAVSRFLVEPLFARLGFLSDAALHTVSLTIGFVFISFLHVVLGEQAPKYLAIQKAEQTALGVALPLRVFYYLFFPVIWVFNASANLLLRAVGIAPAGGHELAHSPEEIRIILEHSEQSGVLSEQRHELMEGALDIADRAVKQIMVPRVDVVYVSTSATWQQIVTTVIEHGYSRFPLCDGDLDHPIGILYAKDLLRYLGQPEGPPSAEGIVALKRECLFVPESQRVETLLKRFQRSRIHMAVVVDEYGGTSGIVTLEDVLEELVGEIQDEMDQEAPVIEETPEGHYRVGGQMQIDDLADRTGVALPDAQGDTDTVGGYIQYRLGRVAVRGDEVKADGHLLKVLEVHRRRIVRVLVAPAAVKDEG